MKKKVIAAALAISMTVGVIGSNAVNVSANEIDANSIGESATDSDALEVVEENEEVAEEKMDAAATVTVNATNFKDPKFRGYLMQFVNEKGQLVVADMKKIDCSGLEIESLDGIGRLTNLEILYCSDNNLTSLDLSGNKKLVELDCSNNEELTVLNLSNCSALTSVLCSNNSIKKLDLRNKGELLKVFCFGNSMEELLVDNDAKLKTLNCKGNKLTNLNLKSCVSLENLTCSDNELESLKVSDCENLISLYCQNNHLLGVDLRGVKNLKYAIAENQVVEMTDWATTPPVLEFVMHGEIWSNPFAYYSDGKVTHPRYDGEEIFIKEIKFYDNQRIRYELDLGPGKMGVELYCIDAPVMNEVKCAANGLTISWNKVDRADKYCVVRREENTNDDWKVVGTTEKTSLVDTMVDSNVSYEYAVYCVAGNKTSSDKDELATSMMSKETKCGKLLASPVITSLINSQPGVKVTWKSVANAESYNIYRKEAEGSWVKIGSAKSTSYRDTTAVLGHSYYYTVRCTSADGKTFTSGYSKSGKQIKYGFAPKLTSVDNVLSGVKITWAFSDDASKYRVYRKTANSSWVKLKDTDKLSFVDTTAESGQTYIYTVKGIAADGKTATTVYDKAGLSKKYIAAPKIISVDKTSDGINIKWAKVNGAVKYRVYKKINGGTWKKVTDTTGLAFKDYDVNANTTYTYTVRCESMDGKTHESAYDAVGKTIEFK